MRRGDTKRSKKKKSKRKNGDIEGKTWRNVELRVEKYETSKRRDENHCIL